MTAQPLDGTALATIRERAARVVGVLARRLNDDGWMAALDRSRLLVEVDRLTAALAAARKREQPVVEAYNAWHHSDDTPALLDACADLADEVAAEQPGTTIDEVNGELVRVPLDEHIEGVRSWAKAYARNNAPEVRRVAARLLSILPEEIR